MSGGLIAARLNSVIKLRRGMRFMDSPNKLIKYHQLTRPQKRTLLSSAWQIILLASLVLVSSSFAADISKVLGKDGESDLIFVKGEITKEDEKTFKNLALNTDSAVVMFDSLGGLLSPAIEIGKTIRIKGYATAVMQPECASACAVAWIAGKPRMMAKNSSVGFHAAYVESADGKKIPQAVGNALVGAYLITLGLNDTVVAYVTTAGPDEIKWLTKDHADRMGLTVSMLDERVQARANFNSAIKNKWGSNPSLNEAVRLYRLSADEGFAGALNNLGDLYETGEGVPKSEKFAVYWYARATERGEPTAYLSLSTFLSEGTSDENILVEALKYAILATKHLPDGKNKSLAKTTIKLIESKISEQAKERAIDLANSWDPLYQEIYLMSDSPAPKN
jgi:TPR repeat protein